MIDPSIVEQRLNAIRNLHDQNIEQHDDDEPIDSHLAEHIDGEPEEGNRNGFVGPPAGFHKKGRGGGRFGKRFPWRRGGRNGPAGK